MLLASQLRKLGTHPRVARQVERELGPLTEGYLPHDLQVIATRALHACQSRRQHRRKQQHLMPQFHHHREEEEEEDDVKQLHSRQNRLEQEMQEASNEAEQREKDAHIEEEPRDADINNDDDEDEDKDGGDSASSLKNEDGPSMPDVLTALRGFVASNVRAAHLDDSNSSNGNDSGGGSAWESLGGLAGPMRELEEMIDLPTRYAPLFNMVSDFLARVDEEEA